MHPNGNTRQWNRLIVYQYFFVGFGVFTTKSYSRWLYRQFSLTLMLSIIDLPWNIIYVVFIYIVDFCQSIPFFKYSRDMLLMYMKNVQYYWQLTQNFLVFRSFYSLTIWWQMTDFHAAHMIYLAPRETAINVYVICRRKQFWIHKRLNISK